MEISGVGGLPPPSPSFPVQQNPSPSFPSPQAQEVQAQKTPPAQRAANNPQPQETKHGQGKPAHDPQPPQAPGPPQGLQASTAAIPLGPGQVVDFHA